MGDQVLRELGWLLDSQQAPGRGMARASDFSARYGGEEFALILPDTSMDGALSAAERLRHRVTTLTMLPRVDCAQQTTLRAHVQHRCRNLSDPCLYSFRSHRRRRYRSVYREDRGKNCVRMALPANPLSSVVAPLVGS